MLRISAGGEEYARGFERPDLGGVMQRGETRDVGGLDIGAVREQEANRIDAIVERGPVQGAATVASRAAVERVNVRTVS